MNCIPELFTFLAALLRVVPEIIKAAKTFRRGKPPMAERFYSLGEVAKLVGVRTWQIQRLIEYERIPAPAWVGHIRIIPHSEIGAVKKAAKAAGYLK